MKVEREVLSTQECLQLMAGVTVGRIGYTSHAMPAILPVRFRIDEDGAVVLEEGAESELVRAVDGAVIALETGEVSGTDGNGWSVTVLGRAGVTPAPPTGPGHPADADEVLIRILPEVVTGRRIKSPPVSVLLP